jgi:hypothetical protein
MTYLKKLARKITATVTQELDEPFSDPVVAVGPPTLHPPAAETPTGMELILGNECEEPTRIYPPGFVESLMGEACAHRHGTVREMEAVKP